MGTRTSRFGASTLKEQLRELRRAEEAERERVESTRQEQNSLRIRLVALFCAPITLVFLIGNHLGVLVERHSPTAPYYQFFFGVIFILSSAASVLWTIRPKAVGQGTYLSICVAAVVGLNLLGMYKVGDRSVYLLALMVCAFLYSAPLKWYAAVFMGAWIASIIGEAVFFPSLRLLPNAVVLGAMTALSLVTGIALEIRRSTTELLAYRLDRKNRELQELSFRDSLTGLYNRRFLIEWLDKQLTLIERTKQPLTLAMIDLDRFKAINDQAGHAKGDEALQAAARVLKTEFREADVIARYGGDEFVVVLPDTTLVQAEVCLERSLEGIRASELPGWDLELAFSAGLAAWREGETPDRLIERADALLYRAKQEGRNRVVADEVSANRS